MICVHKLSPNYDIALTMHIVAIGDRFSRESIVPDLIWIDHQRYGFIKSCLVCNATVASDGDITSGVSSMITLFYPNVWADQRI